MQTRPMIERLLAVAIAVTDAKGMNVTRTASQHEVSTKTITRDKDFLPDRLSMPMDYDHTERVWRGQDKGQIPALTLLSTFH